MLREAFLIFSAGAKIDLIFRIFVIPEKFRNEKLRNFI